MGRYTDYYYKGYDITNKNRLEKIMMELQNPYGYNLESNARRLIDYDMAVTRTNQDFVKNKEYLKNDKA
ncbi:MAG: hypothetical protein K2M17_04720 [Bacilli bacterium]|nr:hypothetical protein [Bacilli bacterium]